MELMHTAHVPAGDGPFPAIVALHGWGANAHDLFGLAPYLHGGEAVVICPQGPISFEIAPGMRGHGWFPISGGGARTDPDEVRRSIAQVRAFLDEALERYPIDRRKLVMLGFSQGGVLGYDLALREPERFSGLVALSSWLPQPLADEIPAQPGHESLPTLVVHGTEDPMIPIARARESREVLSKFGVPLSYREFPMEHGIDPDALRTLVQWLEDKVFTPVILA